jgi:predicted porin
VAGGVQAQNVQLYGLLDAAAGRFQAAGTPRVWRVDNGGMTTSFLGVKGSDDLGGGLRAKFAIEHFLRADTGQAGRFNGDAFWARDAYVGLSGAFGTTVFGRNTTPLFVSTLLFNAFGDSYAFSPSIRQLFTPSLLPFFGDSGWDNSVSYSSGDNDGFSYNLIANLGEGAPGAKGKNLGVNLLYLKGPLGLTAVWQRVKNGAGVSPTSLFTPPAGFLNQETWQLGASYDFAVVKLYGQYTHVRTSAADSSTMRLWSVGASAPIGAGNVLAQYGRAAASSIAGEPIHNTFSVGYDYFLSKRTDVYGVFMNDRLSGLKAGNTLAGGVRLRF